MIGTALIALAAAAPGLGDGFAQFSRSPALRKERVEVAVGVLGTDRASGKTLYWARRVVTDRSGPVTTFADSNTCPSIHHVLDGLAKLEVPTPQVPGLNQPDEFKIIMDGTGYRLTASTQYAGQLGQVTFGSNIDTPLAAWIDDSLARLQGCWTHLPPERPAP